LPAVLPAALEIDPSVARAFALRVTGLAEPHATVANALAHHGYVQIDPINICGRMHDLILRSRVSGYREGDLMRYLHGASSPLPADARLAFEHHLPSTGVLVALEREAWPHLRAIMRARTRRTGAWSGRLSPRERVLAERILAAVAERGPVGSDAVVDDRRARSVWGAATLVKSTMQKLFFHGRLLIAQRDNGRRLYDLPERVLPRSVLEAPEPSPLETARWEAQLKLRQRRLVTLKKNELAVVSDLVQPLRVAGCPMLYCLRCDAPLFETAASEIAGRNGPLAPRLLAPLDPLIYDRALTRQLWDFDYTWEVYTPPAKRRRGYYALPLLVGAELVGDADLRADRAAGRLHVVSRRVRRGFSATPAVRDVAAFLGLR
jgi:uncharacterized protein